MALRRQEAATWRPEMTTRPAWWTVWCVATSPVGNTMASSHARAAKASSRGVSDVTSATHAGERGIMGIFWLLVKPPESLKTCISPGGYALSVACLSTRIKTFWIK